MIELDAGMAALLSLVMVQVSLTAVFVSVQDSAAMLDHAREQEERIVFSDELMNRYGVYDANCRSVVSQTVGELPSGLAFNVSLRKPGEASEAEGVIVRRLVFVGKVSKENERVLEVW